MRDSTSVESMGEGTREYKNITKIDGLMREVYIMW